MTELNIEKLHELLINGEVSSDGLVKEAIEKIKKATKKM